MLDHEVRVEFIRLCRLLIRGREDIGREIGNLCIAQARDKLLMIQIHDYVTICDELTGSEFDYDKWIVPLPVVY